MNKKNIYKKSIFIFRRDLRLEDNIGLHNALILSETVIPLFIFDPDQISASNVFKSNNAIQFMIASLHELSNEIKKNNGKLSIMYGDSDTVCTAIFKKKGIDAVFVNEDYTPFAKKRDTQLQHICKKYNINFHTYRDYLLLDPYAIKTTTKKPYTVFTPFFKKACMLPVDKPKRTKYTSLYKRAIAGSEKESTLYKKILPNTNTIIHVQGGRNAAKKILRNLSHLKQYKKTRDILSIPTSNLSAYIKFGCISIREIYYEIKKNLGNNHDLIRQIYWREFFTHIAFHYPYVFGAPFRKKYTKIKWKNNKTHFKKWCVGKTGFPIVDAGMRQLNNTGYMHNRARLIVASFLVKDLHINWQWGEKYFAQKLVDYDPSVNNGNWQWSASTGCDAQPYFRIFNPWLQQKKYDPECKYIKKWVPELKNIEPKIIHNWHKDIISSITNYPRPIIDHKKESSIAKERYKKVS